MSKIIDMSKLPAPQVIKPVDVEAVLADMRADIIKEVPDAKRALDLEGSTLVKFLERSAYWLMGLAQSNNEDAHAVMLPYAVRADLDQLGAIYQVKRLVVTPADTTTTPPTPAVLEDDEAFRKRIQLAPKSFSVAGPVDAYVFHSLSADGKVKDVAVHSPTPGEVIVTILSHEANGEAAQELLDKVGKALNADDVRPLTDWVKVQSASIATYTVEAIVYTLDGPDTALVMQEVTKSINLFVSNERAIGAYVPLSGIYAALHLNGVEKVELVQPATDVQVSDTQAPYCVEVKITHKKETVKNGSDD